jgi:polyhydroxyalkanoate synthesis regulator phasin
MIEAIKKTLLAGLGAAVITKEKAEAALNDLVKQGKISTADARIMAEKIAEQGRREFDEMSNKMNDRIREMLHSTDRKYEARINGLEDRIRQLEERLASAPPPTAQL